MSFDSFAVAAYHIGMSWPQFTEHLKAQGYRSKVEIPTVDGELSDEEIFEVCSNLKELNTTEREKWLQKQNIPKDQRKIYRLYLKLKPLEISYEYEVRIQDRVSEKSQELFALADKRKQIIICAETGRGKTYGILNEVPIGKKLLFVAPLTLIVEQQGKNSGYVYLKGNSSEQDWQRALKEDVVIATQEQATRLISRRLDFDYVVIDEIHSTISAVSYKGDVIRDFFTALQRSSATKIGLTGTPTQFFEGWKLVKVFVDNEIRQEIIQRVDNRNEAKIVIQHLKGVTGKSIFRVNSRPAIESVVDELVRGGMNPNRIGCLRVLKRRKPRSGTSTWPKKRSFQRRLRWSSLPRYYKKE